MDGGRKGYRLRAEFVGRRRELAALKDCVAAALAGGPRVVLCRGEPGIGKTRLAEELAAALESAGVPTFWGVAAESVGAPPYWPWRQVLRAVSGGVDLAGVAAAHGLTGDLVRLVPDLFPLPAGDPDVRPSHEDRFRLFDAVARLLGEVSRHRPLVIILDDAHWADGSSLSLLEYVASSMVAGQQLLVVVNYRDTEPLPKVLLTDLPRQPRTRELELRGLDLAAVRAQLASAVGRDLPIPAIEQVHARTGGNPFFVSELARTWADRPLAVGEPVSAGVRESIAARLDRLPPPSVRLLQSASIVGREFSVDLVAAMMDRPVLSCLALLDDALSAGFVEAAPTPGKHRFVHDLLRDAVEAGLGTPERVGLHRRAAEVIEQLYAGRLEPHLSDLAWHWAEAAASGERLRAVGWIQRAAEEAKHRLAYEEAARLYRQALAVGAAQLDDEGRCRLLLALGSSLQLAGELSGRLASCREAATLARRLQRPDLLADAALILEGGESGLDMELALRGMCEEALAALDPQPTPLRARVAAHLSNACMYLGDVDTARRVSESALSDAHQSGDQTAVAAALRARQLVSTGPEGLAERAGLAEQLMAIGRQRRDPGVQMWAHLWRIDVAFQRGDLAAVAGELEPLAWCTEEIRTPLARWHLLQCRAVLAQAQGRFADARQLADRAVAALSPSATGHESAIINRTGVLFMICRHTGGGSDVSGLLAHTEPVGSASPEAEFPTEGVIFAIAAAAMLVSAGELAETGRIYRRLGPPGAWRPIPHARTVCYAFGAAVAIAMNASSDVRTLRDLLAPFRGQHLVSGAGAVAYGGPVELPLGVAAAHLGLLDAAVTDLDTAVRICAANGAAGFHVEAMCELAAALARRHHDGDLPRARTLAAEVIRRGTALGTHPWVDRARNLAQQLDHEASGPLSPREREVAELVALGLTNRGIAARLYISERTAQNHVQHILTKLALTNRSQIAVWSSTGSADQVSTSGE
jgi:DNA-binding CsgD family transcriptional regulator/tetratricopeptide (TPR) repeat protein